MLCNILKKIWNYKTVNFVYYWNIYFVDIHILRLSNDWYKMHFNAVKKMICNLSNFISSLLRIYWRILSYGYHIKIFKYLRMHDLPVEIFYHIIGELYRSLNSQIYRPFHFFYILLLLLFWSFNHLFFK